MPLKYGRIPSVPDQRDRLFTVPRIKTTRRYRYWKRPWIGDQGSTPQCVAYGWLGFAHDYPYPHPQPYPFIKAAKLYKLAQENDEFPGSAYEGSSVRGGAKAYKQLAAAEGVTLEYRWANTMAQITSTVLEIGPVVAGTDWREGMEDTDRKGFIHCTGEVVGGHCYVIAGVNLDLGKALIQNSWGASWGNNGCAWISLDDLDTLRRSPDSEFCIAMER